MCVRVYFVFDLFQFVFFVCFFFWNQGQEPRFGQVYPTVLGCVLCLWPLLVKQQRQCGMFSELGGWDSGDGEGCSKAMSVAFEQPLLFQYLYKKRHFKLKFLHLPAMLFATNSEKPVEKSCFLIICLVKQREDLLKSHSYKCSLVCFDSLAYFSCVSTFLFAMDQCRCNHSWSRLFGWSSLEMVTWEDWCHAKYEALALVGLAKRLKRVWNGELNSVTFFHTYNADKSTHSALF